MFARLPRIFHLLRQLDRRAQIYSLSLVFGVAWIMLGLLLLRSTSQNQIEVPDEVLVAPLPEAEKIMVDVAGAVAHPGMYQLSGDSRVADALSAAGGLSDSADGESLKQKINLAEKVSDGQKIYIPLYSPPANGETVATSETGVQSFPESDLISLNKATQKELETLPGIGEKKAADLIAGRPYSSMAAAQAVANSTTHNGTSWKK